MAKIISDVDIQSMNSVITQIGELIVTTHS